jgi:hypothetical protein
MTDLEHYLDAPVKDYYSKLFEDHLRENMSLMKYTTSEYNLHDPEIKINFGFSPGKLKKRISGINLNRRRRQATTAT